MIASHKKDIFGSFLRNYIPSSRDNLKQLFLKIFYILAMIAAIILAFWFSVNFLKERENKKILSETQNIWYSYDDKDQEYPKNKKIAFSVLKHQNNDFSGWIKIDGTDIDCPIYKTEDNDFYVNHNSKRNESKFGAVFFDKKTNFEKQSSNLVIYGNNTVTGSVFSDLYNLRSLDKFKRSSVITLSTPKEISNYKIYALFILNSKKKDDNGKIYNIYLNDFSNERYFNDWVNEAKERSLINIPVNVKNTDKIITLVTNAPDFENARFIVMARQVRQNEELHIDNSLLSLNPEPVYPQKWYDERNIKIKIN